MINFYGYPIKNKGTPCSCCGATYNTKPTQRITAGRGIRIIEGHVGSNDNRRTSELAHITTRNGQLTVVVKHKGK